MISKKIFISSVGLAILLAVLLISGKAYAQDDTPTVTPTPVPQACAECHIDVVANWQTSPHALAFRSETFQTAWHNIDDETTCLGCHTTNYSSITGTYEHDGITCEACHGVTPANHPDEPLAMEPGLAICTDCHTQTYQEWLHSEHGDQQLACTTCHNPHPQTLRFETATALCLDCHTENYNAETYAHASHPEQSCTDCHWHRGTAVETDHLLTGVLLPTGHDANVETLACTDCHAQLVAAESTPVEVSQSVMPLTVSTARLQIDELEAEVAEVRAQGENSSAVHLIQGLVVGGVLGAIVMFVLARVRMSLNGSREGDEEHG